MTEKKHYDGLNTHISYDEFCLLANRLGYDGFTKLQEKAFRELCLCNRSDWLFIIGATGSGKTLVPFLFFLLEWIKQNADRKDYRMLFAVPYRALAAQKKEEYRLLSSRTNVIELK